MYGRVYIRYDTYESVPPLEVQGVRWIREEAQRSRSCPRTLIVPEHRPANYDTDKYLLDKSNHQAYFSKAP